MSEDLATTQFFISNLHSDSCVPTIKDALSALPHPPTSIDISIASQSLIIEHSTLLSLEAIQSSLRVAGFDIANNSTNLHPRPQAFVTEGIGRDVEQCVVSGQDHTDNAEITTDSGEKSSLSSMPSDTTAVHNLHEIAAPEPELVITAIKDESHQAQLSVGGMTCAACVVAITEALSDMQGVSGVNVSLLGKFASVVVTQLELVDGVVERIEDIGYECNVVSVNLLNPLPKSKKAKRKAGSGKRPDGGPMQDPGTEETDRTPRMVSIQVNGMFSQQCPARVMATLSPFSDQIKIIKPITSLLDPVLHISYIPLIPDFTIRTIMSALSAAKSPPYSVAISHPPSPEELAHRIHLKEQRILYFRLAVAVVVAVPTFIIGIVYMTLLRSGDARRMFFEESIWVGQVSRGEWAQFILATPVMFYSAQDFHHRSIKELIALWRPGSPTPLLRRFTRFGSMNLLISMGVSIAYFSSIAALGLAATRSSTSKMDDTSMTYFDSVVFLTMFLLIGRCLEGFSRGHAANAVSLLGQLRGTEALLLVPRHEKDTVPVYADTEDDIEKAYHHMDEDFSTSGEIQKVHVDLLEVGDVVRVLPGSTPPADGTIVSSEKTYFDESSLTGESRDVKKETGDEVFVGTINKLRMVDVRVDAIGGETMLDRIVNVVRQGSTKRAPIERLADILTGYFVPVITLLAILTWVIWLGLGLGGALSNDVLANSFGGWPYWSLEYAIAVFVIACPCGLGLAAPTALLVGSGLAAKFGILVRGGGEAFQEAADLDIIVFDKTGTLTEGEMQVTDMEILPLPHEDPTSHGSNQRKMEILAVATSLESGSSHALATAMHNYCKLEGGLEITGRNIEETAGRGLKGSFKRTNSSAEFEAIIGNEAWMEEHSASLDGPHAAKLKGWKSEGKSVVLLAVCVTALGERGLDDGFESALALNVFTNVAMFAVADPPRKEAQHVVARLQTQGFGTWMISGDNVITAKAVANIVGIPEENVIAGVLPEEKAERILWLQKTGTKRIRSRRDLFGMVGSNERCIVAMVGDGINDAPALTTADVGIAMGSGSDVAISSAKFILVSSSLYTLLTLTDLSLKVFNRVKFNFLWAIVYNIIAVPIAAGVIYPAGHARLGPVWSSLAMALSSTSVVCSSLALRWYKQPSAES